VYEEICSNELRQDFIQNKPIVNVIPLENNPLLFKKQRVSCYMRPSRHFSRSKNRSLKQINLEQTEQKVTQIINDTIDEYKKDRDHRISFEYDDNFILPDNQIKYKKKAKKYMLPQTGIIDKDCQKMGNVVACSSCGEWIPVSKTCNSPKCPVHGVTNRYKRSKKVLERIYSHKLTHKLNSAHFTISIDPSNKKLIRLSKDPKTRNKIDKQIIKYAKEKGVLGGVYVFHPFRMKEEFKKPLYDLFKDKEKEVEGIGEFRLWKILIKYVKNWRDLVYFSPHYHIIGNYTWTKKGSANDKFLFRKIKQFGSYKNKDHTVQNIPQGIINCAMYQLSHAGLSVDTNKKCMGWFGAISFNNWSLDKSPAAIQEYIKNISKEHLNDFATSEGETYNRCSKCGGDLVPLFQIKDYFNNFSSQKAIELNYVFQMFSGYIPPPDKLKNKVIVPRYLK